MSSSQNKGNNNLGKRPVCFKCGAVGHIQADCSEEWRPSMRDGSQDWRMSKHRSIVGLVKAQPSSRGQTGRLWKPYYEKSYSQDSLEPYLQKSLQDALDATDDVAAKEVPLIGKLLLQKRNYEVAKNYIRNIGISELEKEYNCQVGFSDTVKYDLSNSGELEYRKEKFITMFVIGINADGIASVVSSLLRDMRLRKDFNDPKIIFGIVIQCTPLNELKEITRCLKESIFKPTPDEYKIPAADRRPITKLCVNCINLKNCSENVLLVPMVGSMLNKAKLQPIYDELFRCIIRRVIRDQLNAQKYYINPSNVLMCTDNYGVDLYKMNYDIKAPLEKFPEYIDLKMISLMKELRKPIFQRLLVWHLDEDDQRRKKFETQLRLLKKDSSEEEEDEGTSSSDASTSSESSSESSSDLSNSDSAPFLGDDEINKSNESDSNSSYDTSSSDDVSELSASDDGDSSLSSDAINDDTAVLKLSKNSNQPNDDVTTPIKTPIRYISPSSGPSQVTESQSIIKNNDTSTGGEVSSLNNQSVPANNNTLLGNSPMDGMKGKTDITKSKILRAIREASEMSWLPLAPKIRYNSSDIPLISEILRRTSGYTKPPPSEINVESDIWTVGHFIKSILPARNQYYLDISQKTMFPWIVPHFHILWNDTKIKKKLQHTFIYGSDTDETPHVLLYPMRIGQKKKESVGVWALGVGMSYNMSYNYNKWCWWVYNGDSTITNTRTTYQGGRSSNERGGESTTRLKGYKKRVSSSKRQDSPMSQSYGTGNSIGMECESRFKIALDSLEKKNSEPRASDDDPLGWRTWIEGTEEDSDIVVCCLCEYFVRPRIRWNKGVKNKYVAQWPWLDEEGSLTKIEPDVIDFLSLDNVVDGYTKVVEKLFQQLQSTS